MTDPAPVDISGLTISVLGGTGEQGRGLARRFALAGSTVVLGSRDAGRAAAAAADLPGAVTGTDNASAAAAGDVVVVAVPWDGHRE
ncbi:MAG: npdG, partial [Frankiales bacterium]|nr:npdG [Frankiales bacterium]